MKKTLTILLVCLATATFAQTSPVDSVQVLNTMNKFIEVFSNLELDKFMSYFADDATAFYPPSAKYPFRADNKKAIESIFKPFFENVKKQKAAPPYLSIVPKDLKIQVIDSIAIVTFMLDDPGLFGRRSFILKKQNSQWLILHLHASGVVARRSQRSTKGTK